MGTPLSKVTFFPLLGNQASWSDPFAISSKVITLYYYYLVDLARSILKTRRNVLLIVICRWRVWLYVWLVGFFAIMFIITLIRYQQTECVDLFMLLGVLQGS